MKMRQYLLIVLISVVFCTSGQSESVDETVAKEIAAIRATMGTFWDRSGFLSSLIQGAPPMGDRLYSYESKLVNLGPNALPELMKARKREEISRFDSFLGQIIYKLGWFFPYHYVTREYQDVSRRNLLDTNLQTMPFLSICEDESGVGDWGGLHKSLLLEWWDQRDTFLRRTDVVETVRRITGTKEDDYAKWGIQASRQLRKHVRTYGIYNIPYFLQVVREDNNPIIFWDLLRLIRHDVFFKNATPGFDQPRVMQTLYPSCESKLYLLIKDWEDNKHKYTNLPDLYAAIDAQIKSAKEMKKTAEPPIIGP